MKSKKGELNGKVGKKAVADRGQKKSPGHGVFHRKESAGNGGKGKEILAASSELEKSAGSGGSPVLHQSKDAGPGTGAVNPLLVGSLRGAPYNPRKITDEGLANLKKSMEEFGDLSAIVLNRRTGHLVGGHQRVKNLDPTWEIQTSPVTDRVGTVAVGYVVTPNGPWNYREVDWPEEKEKAANISANKQRAEFDIPILKDLFSELDAANFDISLTGFSEAEMMEIIEWAGASVADADKVPAAPKEATSKAGDLWILGNHRLLCGDSANPEDVKRLMGEDRADVIFTDPPYGVSIGAKNRLLNSFQKAGRNLTDIESDDLAPDELKKILLPSFGLMKSMMKDDCSVFVTAPQGGGLGPMMMMMMMESDLEVRHVLIWKKNSPTFSMGRLDYDYAHEPILFTWGAKHNYYGGGQHKTSVWEINKPMASKEHPTMKPVELYVNAFLNHSKPGDIVYEPFAGSGTAFIASEQIGRKCRGMEISPIYCDVIVKRWEELTGKKAVLEKIPVDTI